jgi:hypothetical protein
MECDFHGTLYKRRLKTTRGMSTSQTQGNQGQDVVLEQLEDAFRSTQKPAVLGYEELGGL